MLEATIIITPIPTKTNRNTGAKPSDNNSTEENIASAKALESNDFVKKEIIESAINVCGEEYDQVIYEKVYIM